MRVAMIVTALAMMGVLHARPVQACTCIHIAGCGAIRSTDVVFEATVASIEPEQPRDPQRPWTQRHIVKLTEIKALRGKPESIIFISKATATSCDYTAFEVGTRYVVHAHVIAEGYLGVSMCGMTRPIAAAKDVLACVKRD
jgi:hypothetical protein